MPVANTSSPQRLRLVIRGAVQGVGFRPFVFRLAKELDLAGWVNNSPQGVFVEVEGAPPRLESFLLRVERERPPRSFIQSLEASWLDAVGYREFEIRESEAGGGKTALVLPDIATCPDCLRDIFDPENRRYGYPFTNCTNCGPRFTIVEALPYDRANTSMREFKMCRECQAEYDDPSDRRFHAQPNACPWCGPHLELWNRAGEALARDSEAMASAAEAVRLGQILAVKGLGGFHLIVAANHDSAVRRLRDLKHREEKPFAVMFPSFESVRSAGEISPLEERLLRSPEAPIVLLRRRCEARLSSWIAPGNPYLGVMLPYTPLHHLLLSALGFAVVATSGNLSDEPICTDEREALSRLGGIADCFLVHNRRIVRHVDDSIVRVMMGRELVLRRARGYAPLPVGASRPGSDSISVLAVGAHLKNTIALSVGPQAFLSQHIGDLETDQAFGAFRRVIEDFQSLYEVSPSVIATDAHPDYLSTQYARERLSTSASLAVTESSLPSSPPSGPLVSSRPAAGGTGLVSVQHHLAHVLSCMAENELEPPALGVSWDGTGYGLDGTIWGGEFFLVAERSASRIAHPRQFRLPGGDKSVKEPRRTALGVLYEMFGDEAFGRRNLAPLGSFTPAELMALKTMLIRGVNSPLTSSVGRLFDAAAALAGLRQRVRFEGQAAMEFEFAIEGVETEDAYPIALLPNQDVNRLPIPSAGEEQRARFVYDWAPMFEALIADVQQGIQVGLISARFHNALAEVVVSLARAIGQERIVLSGGCFQNRYLTERVIFRLRQEGFRPYWHQRVPPNDGGIALGQVAAAKRGMEIC